MEAMESRKAAAPVQDYKAKETEQSLNNYMKLYSEVQSKLKSVEDEKEGLKREVARLSSSGAESKRTEELQAQQETRWKN